MNSDQILKKLNDWYNCHNVIIPENSENKKELEFIKKSRVYSNDGILSGPYSIEAAKECLKIGLQPGDFSCEGGAGYTNQYFFYGWSHSLQDIQKTHNYYKEIEMYINKYGISKSSFRDYWLKLGNDQTEYKEEIERDLTNYTLSEHLKKQIQIISKEINKI